MLYCTFYVYNKYISAVRTGFYIAKLQYTQDSREIYIPFKTIIKNVIETVGLEHKLLFNSHFMPSSAPLPRQTRIGFEKINLAL